jgi:hypothetical protein
MKMYKKCNEMSCEVICNQSFAQLEVAPSKRQVNITSSNKGITFCASMALYLAIIIAICLFYSKSR